MSRSAAVSFSCRARRPGLLCRLIASAIVAGSSPAVEAFCNDTMAGDSLRLRGKATYGAAWRAADRTPAFVFGANAAALDGGSGAPLFGKNTDDGNLNYDKGDQVYSVFKALGVADLNCGEFAARMSALAWTDRVAAGRGMPWGHAPNGYVEGAELSDAGVPHRARYSGLALQEAWVQWGRSATVQDAPSAIRSDTARQTQRWVRLGQQYIPWGAPVTRFGGGLEQVNAEDMLMRALPGTDDATRLAYARTGEVDPMREGFVPAGSVLARWTEGPALFEGFYQYGFEPNVLPGCGRFDSLADYVADGCDRVYVGAMSDRLAQQTGLFARRAPDVEPGGGGQYGVRLQYDAFFGRIAFYAANIHSRRYIVSAIKSTRVGLPPLIPGDPGGQNVQYYLEYPEDIRLFGLSWSAVLNDDRTRLNVEYVMQPDQALRLNNTDMLNAFGSTVAPTPLRTEADGLAPGARFSGYDRYRVSQLRLSGAHDQPRVLGADRMTVSGEVGVKSISGLPSPHERRYGRSDAFGLGPVNGACTGSAIQCSTDGYVSSSSWGYRLRIELEYAVSSSSLRLIPSLSWLHDVKGWSWDDAINEGRRGATTALRLQDRLDRWFSEVSWTAIWGGDYNPYSDRDVVRWAIGVRYE